MGTGPARRAALVLRRRRPRDRDRRAPARGARPAGLRPPRRSSTTTTSCAGSRALGAVFVDVRGRDPGRRDLRPLGARRRAGRARELRAPRPAASSTRSARSSRRCTPRRAATPTAATSSRSSATGDHVEVIGTKGERPGPIVVVESPEEARALETNGKPRRGDHADDALAGRRRADRRRARRPRRRTLKRPAADDICYATQNRQDAVKEIVSMGASLILVIGSPTSSNAQRLVEVARGARRARRG